MSDANLLEIKTKHSWLSSDVPVVDDEDEVLILFESPLVRVDGLEPPVLAMKLKYFFTPFSSAQYEILCNGNWCRMFVVLGSYNEY